jgi:formamidopyrimidine-DNA glycosylase
MQHNSHSSPLFLWLEFPMPELPEVEITRRGIAPQVEGHTVTDIVIRNPRLRWPVPKAISKTLAGLKIIAVKRRAKYLILETAKGSLLLHLGMSGSLRVLERGIPATTHDHVDIVFGDHMVRFRDPRRFGCLLWHTLSIESHPLLKHLGVEPLGAAFTGEYLHRATRGRKVAIKQLIMNQAIVVGVGNIYASESLFRAGIRPQTQAQKLTRVRCDRLAQCIVETLNDALDAGGSSLRDYVQSTGELGCFQLRTFVYDRDGEPCRTCGSPIKVIRQGQRSTFYCPTCQK